MISSEILKILGGTVKTENLALKQNNILEHITIQQDMISLDFMNWYGLYLFSLICVKIVSTSTVITLYIRLHKYVPKINIIIAVINIIDRFLRKITEHIYEERYIMGIH